MQSHIPSPSTLHLGHIAGKQLAVINNAEWLHSLLPGPFVAPYLSHSPLVAGERPATSSHLGLRPDSTHLSRLKVGVLRLLCSPTADRLAPLFIRTCSLSLAWSLLPFHLRPAAFLQSSSHTYSTSQYYIQGILQVGN